MTKTQSERYRREGEQGTRRERERTTQGDTWRQDGEDKIEREPLQETKQPKITRTPQDKTPVQKPRTLTLSFFTYFPYAILLGKTAYISTTMYMILSYIYLLCVTR